MLVVCVELVVLILKYWELGHTDYATVQKRRNTPERNLSFKPQRLVCFRAPSEEALLLKRISLTISQLSSSLFYKKQTIPALCSLVGFVEALGFLFVTRKRDIPR